MVNGNGIEDRFKAQKMYQRENQKYIDEKIKNFNYDDYDSEDDEH